MAEKREQIEPTAWREIEQAAGAPMVAPVDRAGVEAHRKAVYLSYENFLRERLAGLDEARADQWSRDYSSLAAYQRSIEPMREKLNQMLGFWIVPDERKALELRERTMVYDEPRFVAHRFKLEVLPGLWTYGIELTPKEKNSRAPAPAREAGLLVQHGYAGTPEVACGLTANSNADDYSYRSLGLRAVCRGFHVVAIHHPSGYGKIDDEVSGIPAPPGYPHQPTQYGKNRLHRMAILAGGTLFGLDMMASSRAVDLLLQRDDVDPERIGMYGLSQGGQSALYLPAMDTRIKASVSSAYFNHRFRKLIGPTRALSYLDSLEEDKFFSHVISHFSDSDLVSLIAPRALAVEAGLHDRAVDFELAQHEFARARAHYEKLNIPERIEFIAHDQGHVSATSRALDFLEERLGA